MVIFHSYLDITRGYISISDGNMLPFWWVFPLPRSATSRRTATRPRMWWPSSAALTSLGPFFGTPGFSHRSFFGGCLMGKHYGFNMGLTIQFSHLVHYKPLMIPHVLEPLEVCLLWKTYTYNIYICIYIYMYTHTHIYIYICIYIIILHIRIISLRLRGGLGWWFGSLGNHCLQHILLKFKVCT